MLISYKPVFVMLSVFIAITGAVTGLTLTAGYSQRQRRAFSLALFKGAVALGASIWAAQFVTMLAIRFPLPASYNLVQAMVSFYVAIIGAALGLLVVSGRRLGALSSVAGGLLMGGTIAGTHYLGMGALYGIGTAHPTEGIITSVAMATVASIVALWFAFRKRGTAETLIGGLLLGLAMPAVYYIAIAGTEFHYLRAMPHLSAPLISREVLTATVGVVALVICGTFLFLFAKLALGGGGQPRRLSSGGRAR